MYMREIVERARSATRKMNESNVELTLRGEEGERLLVGNGTREDSQRYTTKEGSGQRNRERHTEGEGEKQTEQQTGQRKRYRTPIKT